MSRKNDVHRKPACEFEIQSDHRHLPAMSLAFDREDFSFVVKMRGAPAKPWVWEIHRAGKSGPVERSPVCYAPQLDHKPAPMVPDRCLRRGGLARARTPVLTIAKDKLTNSC